MMRERERSIEGRGVREFATVREFGINYDQFVKDAGLVQNKSQIFYRGDAGIDVLFKIIELAAENMIQNRKITGQWLKNAFGAEDIKTFQSLAWFTREPLFSLIKDFPVYKEFCKWVDTLNGKISATASKDSIFGFLETLSPAQLAPLLENEAPVIAATVLSRLSPNVSAETLVKFPPNLKTEILKHIARKSEVFPDVLERVAAVLRERTGAKVTDISPSTTA